MPPFMRETSYDMILKNIFTTVKDVFGQFASFVVRQEMNENNGPINNHLTVSGDGTSQLIWKLSPKHLPGGAVPVGIAAYLSACIFNEGKASILKVFEGLGVPCGSNSHEFIENADEKRISLAEQRAQTATREARMARRQHQLDFLEAASSSEHTLYGPGIGDDL